MKQQIARLNYLRIAPRKVRAVGDLVRGLSVNEAEAQLLMQTRRAARPLLKLLRSAVSNATTGDKHLDITKLYIATIRVDQGPMLKRFMPRARGSASEIQKKMSHVFLVLGEKENAVSPRFKIVAHKKDKQPERERKIRPRQSKKAIPERVEKSSEKEKSKEPRLLTKMFNRKSSTGK